MKRLRWWCWRDDDDFSIPFRPTDRCKQKGSIFQSTISALWNWPKSNLEIARGGGGTETLRPLRQKYRNTVEKYEKYAQIPVSLVGFILKRSGWVLTQPVQIRDDHHRQEGRESRRRWLERQIQKKDRNTNTKTNTKTDTHTQIRRNIKYTIAKRSECKKSNVAVPPPRFLGAKVRLRKNWYLSFRRSVLRFKKKENHQNLILEMMGQ